MTNSKLRDIKSLSDLLQYALQDFITFVESGAPVSMSDWLVMTQEGQCVGTCVAGAVMHETLGIRNVGRDQSHYKTGNINITPFNMIPISENYADTPESYLLVAINQIRSGEIFNAHGSFTCAHELIMDGKLTGVKPRLPEDCPICVSITYYDDSPQNFFFDCGSLYALLIKHGL